MTEYLDLEFIKRNFSNDMSFYHRLCEKQYNDFKNRENDFINIINKKDHKQIKKICHYFKSSFSGLGWSGAISLVSNLSLSSESTDTNLLTMYQELSRVVQSTKQELITLT